MDISSTLLKLKNKIRSRMLLEVNAEGDAKSSFYPNKCNIVNKNTGEKWSVEFHSKPYDDPDGISPTQWYAELKDAQGKSIEKRDIARYFEEKTTDKILTEKSGYSPIWDAVNIEFKKFQKKHRCIKNKENKMRQNAEIVSAMKRVESLLDKKRNK